MRRNEKSPIECDFRIEIIEKLSPMDRGEKYDDPICKILEDSGVGFVFGGGTKLSTKREVEFCYVDVRAHDAHRAKALVSQFLLQVGASPETKIDGKRLGKGVKRV